MRVAIIDCEMGNLFSVHHACTAVGLKPVITSEPGALLDADAAILPGVGAFARAMENLRVLGLVSAIREFIARGRPFLGVCLGMQLLFEESEEFGSHRGLGLLEGRVIRFRNEGPDGSAIRVPQIGWNRLLRGDDIQPWHGSPLRDVRPGEFMYFVHSYYAVPANRRDILSLTDYEGIQYCSGIRRNNIFATQFHPEKSAEEGLRIYRNWATDIRLGSHDQDG